MLGLGAWVPVAREIIHFTGYEVPFAQIEAACRPARHQARAPDRHRRHDRARWPTAVIWRNAATACTPSSCWAAWRCRSADGGRQVKYASGLDLLRQTPEFVAEVRAKRLDGEFGAAYRYLESLYGGRNPYMEAIDRNVDYLRQVLRSENWRLLRRSPPIFAATADPMSTMRGLMLGYIKRVWANG